MKCCTYTYISKTSVLNISVYKWSVDWPKWTNYWFFTSTVCKRNVRLVKDRTWLYMARQRIINNWCLGEWTDGWKDERTYWWTDIRSNRWTYEMDSWLILGLNGLIGTCIIRWKNHAYHGGKYVRYQTNWNKTYRVESLGRLKSLSEEDYEFCRGIKMLVYRTYEGLIG